MNFELSKEEEEKYQKWLAEHDKTCPLHPRKAPTAIGGRITFCFTPTGLGVIIGVECSCGEKVDLTNYEEW